MAEQHVNKDEFYFLMGQVQALKEISSLTLASLIAPNLPSNRNRIEEIAEIANGINEKLSKGREVLESTPLGETKAMEGYLSAVNAIKPMIEIARNL